MKKQVSFFKPYYDNKEIKAVTKCIKSGWLTQGTITKQYEELLKLYSCYNNAIACEHATAGLFLAIRTSGLPKGSTILVPTYTFTASASTVLNNNYKLKLCDVDKNTYCINEGIVNKHLEEDKNINAVVNVDMFGYDNQLCNLVRPVKIINDRAHCIPFNIIRKGVSIFSTYANKTISTGEGGFILTNDNEQAKKIRILLNHGIEKTTFERYKGDTSKKLFYDVIDEGWKFNFTDLQSSIGIEQLKKIDDIVFKRLDIVREYLKYLNLNKVQVQSDIDKMSHHRHLFVVRVPLDKRDWVINKLSESGIQTSWHYRCLHEMTYYKQILKHNSLDFPNAYYNSMGSISLPFYTGLKKSEVKYICEKLNSLL